MTRAMELGVSKTVGTGSVISSMNRNSEGVSKSLVIVKISEKEPNVDKIRTSSASVQVDHEIAAKTDDVGLSKTEDYRHRRRDDKTIKSKRIKKSIFISYSPDAGYNERKLIVETVRQLKENNLAEDIWFDNDENITHSPCWFSARMEAVEKCRAVILFLSNNYFTCPVSLYEGKTILERLKHGGEYPRVFSVVCEYLTASVVPSTFHKFTLNGVHLAEKPNSLAEKSSVVVGSFMESLEKIAVINAPFTGVKSPDADCAENFRRRKICQWTVNDLQDWLLSLNIREFYRQNLAESSIDGFLITSVTEHDMIHALGIDSRAARKKIMQNLVIALDKEHSSEDGWHLRAQVQRPKADAVYIVCDPSDVRLACTIQTDLEKNGLQVFHHDHERLGNSKEDFLRINGRNISICSRIVLLLTEAFAASPFCYHESLFTDWLGKKMVVALFNNVWLKLRASLKSVIGDCIAVDFESQMYHDSLEVLLHHIKPIRIVPGVVLEQSFIDKITDGLRPLKALASKGEQAALDAIDETPKVYLSYQYDMQSKVYDIVRTLQTRGVTGFVDAPLTSQRGTSSQSCRSNASLAVSYGAPDQMEQHLRSASVVLCCITERYLQSASCVKELAMMKTLQKPIIPVILEQISGQSALPRIRRAFSRWNIFDLSDKRQFRRNISHVVNGIKKYLNIIYIGKDI